MAEAIDLQANEQHPLPWYPPICVNIVDLKQGDMFMDHLDSIKDRDKVPIRLADESMKKVNGARLVLVSFDLSWKSYISKPMLSFFMSFIRYTCFYCLVSQAEFSL